MGQCVNSLQATYLLSDLKVETFLVYTCPVLFHEKSQ